MSTSLKTQKLYYTDQYLKKATAKITALTEEYIITDRTIAYPEGGGQESDRGWISKGENRIHFHSATLTEGNPIHLKGFKGGKTGGRIRHHINKYDFCALKGLTPGEHVIVSIDTERRQRLTISHSASHFLYAAILQIRPGLSDRTLGCHIGEERARFDFSTQTPFSQQEVMEIEEIANQMISLNDEIRMEHHPEHLDARVWKYGNLIIPCGGTHLPRPAPIGQIRVSRKNLGKGKERLICSFSQAIIDTSHYHE